MAFLHTGDLTPQEIITKFSYFQVCSHFYHLTTTSYEEHKSLGALYEGINDLKDDIIETLYGYVARIPSISLNYNMVYKGTASSVQLTQELRDFATQGEKLSNTKGWTDLSNKFQELKGLASHTLYLLTLK